MIFFNVLSGNYIEKYASFINKNSNEEDYVFLVDTLDDALKINDNHVNFVSIRKKRVSSTGKYYLRGNTGEDLTRLVNKDLIYCLQKEDKKGQSDFDEDVFEKTSDISSMYA